jgi:poly-gamma-glutamate capsule biosynthesis protein CapA/YwtB (metallophosphatase superfamily)
LAEKFNGNYQTDTFKLQIVFSMKSTTVIVGGDLAPTRSNYSYFTEGNIKALIDDRLLSVLESADHRIFNLELPLTDTKKPISKDGPNLLAPVSTLNGIKLLNPGILSLANNHILDHDEQGLFKTMEQLSVNHIGWVGAGRNLAEAARPAFIESGDVKIGIYACAENEFSIAEENKAGANPFDPLESLDHVASLKSKSDFVIVLYHGGKEHYRYPSPYLQKVCRKLVEKGADLVICQHSHCIGAFEKYRDSQIVYGQGNFLFDHANNVFWQTSVIVKATFGNKMSVSFVPICKMGLGIGLPDEETGDAILKAFDNRSQEISKPGFIESEYEKFCSKNGLYYLGAFAGLGRILRKADGIMKGILTRQIYSRKKLNMLQNFIECEAHRELFLNYLRTRRKKR